MPTLFQTCDQVEDIAQQLHEKRQSHGNPACRQLQSRIALQLPHSTRRACMDSIRSFGRAFLVAVAAVACVEVARRFAIVPLVGVDAPLMTFMLSVIAAAWFGGLAPGLLAT